MVVWGAPSFWIERFPLYWGIDQGFFAREGIDMLALACGRAHRYGFKLMPTLRMSALYHRGPKYEALAKWKVKGIRRHLLDYAHPEVRAHIRELVRYFLEHYDPDPLRSYLTA